MYRGFLLDHPYQRSSFRTRKLMMGFTQQAAEDEQKELRTKIKTLQEGIERTRSKAVTADMFISSVRKYTRARKLTPRMLDELVQYIEVHQAEKVNGTWVQRLTIHYNCVGAISIPGALPLPVPDITVNTRKGVYVSYQPDMRAG